MAEYNLFVKFTTELVVDGAISLPNLLLKGYKKMGLNETELLLLLHLWRFNQEEGDSYPTPEDIAFFMTMDGNEVQALMAGLIEKKVLSVEHLYHPQQGKWVNRFSLDGLFDKLMENWALLKAQELETDQKPVTQLSEEVAQEIFKTFEEEFGRLLSPFESSQILEWCHQDHYAPELVLEALRKASIRGIKNLKYIDSILLDWRNNKIVSLEQVEDHEKEFLAKQHSKMRKTEPQTRKEQQIKQKTEKYKDVYMS